MTKEEYETAWVEAAYIVAGWWQAGADCCWLLNTLPGYASNDNQLDCGI